MKKRKNCVICNSTNFELLYNFKKFPIYMGIAKTNDDKFYDQKWVICKDCGTIQLEKLVKLEELYQVCHNPAVGNMWKLHHENFSEYVSKYSGKNILEIGGGNLIIANKICEILPSITTYVIYDKHFDYNKIKHAKISLNKRFFKENSNIKQNLFDTIILSHTFEHFYDVDKYCAKFNKLLNCGGKIIISIPNIKQWLLEKYTNALQFEHTYMVDDKNIEFLMAKHGFKLIDINWFSKYNYFAVFEKQDNTPIPDLDNKYQENKEIFNNFIHFQENNIHNINEKINELNEYTFFIFGCHVFAQYMSHFGLSEYKMTGLLDNDVNKQGYRLYGTSLMTYSPEIIQNIEKPCVIVQAGIYTEEICKQLTSINKNIKIIK